MHTKTENPRKSTGLLGALVALALGAAACGGDVEVTGKVSDEAGQQQQGLSGAPALGGQGTVAAATEVKAYSVGPGGALSALASAQVQADASYSLSLPQGSERVVLQAVNAQGQVVASALLDAAVTARGEATRAAPRMSSESSLEAEVFVKMVADGAAVSTVDTVDLRARIDAKVAQRARAESAEAQAKTVAALAAATRSAQEAEVKAYAKAGVTVTQEQLFEASLQASAKLDSALQASAANAVQAYETFFTAVRADTTQTNETQEAEAERASSASFRAVVDVRLDASGGTSSVADAALRSAALLEARAADAAVQASLKAAGATDATLTRAATAATALRTSIASGSGMASAWTQYSTSLTAGGEAGVLGSFLGASANVQLAAASTAAAQASTALSGRLLDVVSSTLGGLLNVVNVTAVAEGMVNAYDTYHDAARANATTALQATAGAKTAAAVEVIVVANGHVEL